MAEWGVTPDYIQNNWTEEFLNLMIEKLEERRERERKAIPSHDENKTSDTDFFRRLGNKIKVIKK